jgi:hypothetical protein
MEFYLDFYDLLAEEILRVVEESRISRKILGALNANFITLIPKKSEPSLFW